MIVSPYIWKDRERERKERGNLATRVQIFWSSKSDALEQIPKGRKAKGNTEKVLLKVGCIKLRLLSQ